MQMTSSYPIVMAWCCALLLSEGLPTCEVVKATVGASRGEVLVLAAASDHLTILHNSCHIAQGISSCTTQRPR